MGGYASTPRKSKVSEDGGDHELRYAASGMQGWRAGMEDAHVAILRVPSKNTPSVSEIWAASVRPTSGRRATHGGDSQRHHHRHASGPINSTAVNQARDRASSHSQGDSERHRLTGQENPLDRAGNAGDASSRHLGNERPDTGRQAKAEAGSTEGWRAVDLLDDAALFGVFDGHGGKAVADFCREQLPGLLAVTPEIRAGNWREGFPKVYHALDELLRSGQAQGDAGWGGSKKIDGVGMGCTIVTALLDRKRSQCYVAHAGDSRCVLCRAGRAVQLTRDHKPGLPAEYSRIMAAGGHVSRVGRVNDNLNLSRAIGDMAYKKNRLREPKDQIISAEPDLCRFEVTPGVDEFLLLACDGVWEMMNTTQVVAFVRAGLKAGTAPRVVCESLLDACLSPDPRGTRYAGCDNMTVVLVLLEGSEAALASHALPPSATFHGGRLGSVAEAAAALSATLPSVPRPADSSRPPLPEEFRTQRPARQTHPTAGTERSIVATSIPRQVGATSAASFGEVGSATRAGSSAAKADPELRKSVAIRAGAPMARGDSAIYEQDLRRRGVMQAHMEAQRRALLHQQHGWPEQRLSNPSIAAGPRSAHPIEFVLASFAPSNLPRKNSSALQRHRSSPHHDRPLSIEEKESVATRSRNGHVRAATTSMLPSPLVNNRRRPSEDGLIAAAAVAAFAGVGAAGAVAAADPVLGGDAGCEKIARGEKRAMGRATGHERDGIVYVRACEDMSPVDVTVSTADWTSCPVSENR